jgi:hypothetical protein
MKNFYDVNDCDADPRAMIWTALQPYVTRLGNTPFALWIGMSTWRIAGLLTVHLFGLTLLLGR